MDEPRDPDTPGVRAVARGVRRFVVAAREGIVAQGLTFGSTLLPIVWGLNDALIFLVFVSGVVTIAASVTTLAISIRLPPMVEDRDARSLVLASLGLISVSTVVGVATAGVLALAGNRQLAAMFLAAAVLLLGQASFMVSLAIRTRALDYGGIQRRRLAYGVLVFILTLLACLARFDGLGFVLLAAVAYLGAIACTTRRNRSRSDGGPISLGDLVRQARASIPLVLSGLLGTSAGQIGSLALPLLGQYQAAWAAVVRIAGGFQTVGAQIVGPKVDIDFARRLQSGSAASLTSALRRGVWLSSVIGGLSVLFSVVAVVWIDPEILDKSPAEVGWMLMAVVGFAGFFAGTSVIGRLLGMFGSAMPRLFWDASRLVGAFAALSLLHGIPLLAGIGFLGVLSTALYVALLQLVVRARNREAIT
ncbi:hypothetical protein [Agromyces bauzanensis]|uniref:Uncharacterized protein n=1 Tax=Agromyces bauzanensis TaxID=1308924 RepID=A0A917UVU0_9MICO|nr:hypothetical protein [Agromyces bauzanensis]GGJ90140.1 hypothetical protein GCM10011372_30850 [Agromyces bauzanensis]